MELVTHNFAFLLCLLANCDDRAERALVRFLGQGIDNGVRIVFLSPNMLKDVVFCGPQGKITDRQGHIRVSFRVTIAVVGMEAGMHSVRTPVNVIEQGRHLGWARILGDDLFVNVGDRAGLQTYFQCQPPSFNLYRLVSWSCGSALPTER